MSRLFLSSKNFQQSTAPPRCDSAALLDQVDHITASYRCRGFVQNCKFSWSTYAESDHALVLIRFWQQLSVHQRKPQIRIATERFSNQEICISN